MDKKNSNFFITGGAGFIGSHLVDRLLNKKQNKVTVFDNLANGDRKHISIHESNPNFKFIEADLNNIKQLKSSMRGHDIVFHLAANTDNRNEIDLPTDLQIKENIQNTYNVLESMRLNNIIKIVFPSSATIYGDSKEAFSESYGPLLPTSLYGASKLTGEAFISSFHFLFGINAWIFRFSNIVGSRMNHGVIFDFIEKLSNDPTTLEILGDGEQRKPFVHVDECIDAIFHSLSSVKEGINVFNIGCTASTCIKDIGKMVAQEMGLTNVKYKFTGGNKGWINDVPVLRFNVNKLKTLGWSARLTSDQAVINSIKDLLNEK